MSKSKTTLLFSGGRDSSLAACLLARDGHELHLLTCDNGVSIGHDLSAYRYAELIRVFPTQIAQRHIASSMGLFRRIALKDIERDFATYKTNLIILGSQLAMHAEAIIYCIRHGMSQVATGYASYQNTYAEQMTPAIDELRQLVASYGLNYTTPVYNYSGEEAVKYALLDFGITTKSLEAVSIFGDTFSQPPPALVVQYLRDKLAVCRDYIEHKLGDAGKRRPSP